MDISRRYVVRGFIGLTVFVAGVGAGILLPIQSPIQSSPDVYENGTTYKFINPLLECGDDNFSYVQNGQVMELQKDINAYIASEEAQGALDTASVYFRVLNGGQSFEIDPTFEFIPASLLKVPLAMSIYQQAELQPSLLTHKVFFSGTASPAQEYFTAPTIAASSTYTVEQLVDAMLTNSDNNAALLLVQQISTVDLDNSYSNLGLGVPTSDGYTMTTSQYAGFFRVLYNATYLNRADSEHMLDLLSRSAFTQGLVAGVPVSITVSHKFGERGYENSEPNQLHDCGIIYAKNPYLLCVATQAADYDVMAGIIAHISQMVYAYAGP